MDPWWNPAVERQAQDRIHRIGQHRPIRYAVSVTVHKNSPRCNFCSTMFVSDCWLTILRITRFVIENTVEERILRLQEKKELVFEG